jgi:hypothetical protein
MHNQSEPLVCAWAAARFPKRRWITYHLINPGAIAMAATTWIGLPTIILLATVLTLMPAAATAQTRQVTINRVRLSSEQITAIERRYRIHIVDGDYWYDRRLGVWGVWGGPAAGFAVPGLDLGGPLPRDASRGGTRVFVNGRELHPHDVAELRTVMLVLPGRYWLDASGWGGYEGGPPLFNLWALAAQAQSAGRGGASWIHRGAFGGIGGDGECTYYISGNTGASVGCG